MGRDGKKDQNLSGNLLNRESSPRKNREEWVEK